MYILFKNATLLTMSDNDLVNGIITPRKNECLLVKDDLIDFIGDEASLQSHIEGKNIDKTIDCKGNVIMPGFVNAHSHLPMAFVKNYADNLPLDKWLNDKIFPLEAKLTPDDIYWFTKMGILESLSSGITSSFDMYYQLNAMAKAAIEMGFRITLTDAVMCFDKEQEKSERLYHEINENPNDKYKLARYCYCLHAVYTNNDKTFNYISDLIHKYKSPLNIHNSETQKEIDDCINQYKMTPTALLDKYGLLDFGGNHAHCVYLSDGDIDLLKKHDVVAAINMSSNLKLNSGIPDVKKYLDKNLTLAIGTDSVSSNNTLDMFREMYIITVLSKVKSNDLNAVDPSMALLMATRNGALASNDNNIGVLEKGKKADIIEIDMSLINVNPINDLVHSLVYSAGRENIKRTMVNGKILYEEGKYKVDADVDEIIKEVKKRTEDIMVR